MKQNKVLRAFLDLKKALIAAKVKLTFKIIFRKKFTDFFLNIHRRKSMQLLREYFAGGIFNAFQSKAQQTRQNLFWLLSLPPIHSSRLLTMSFRGANFDAESWVHLPADDRFRQPRRPQRSHSTVGTLWTSRWLKSSCNWPTNTRLEPAVHHAVSPRNRWHSMQLRFGSVLVLDPRSLHLSH